MEAQLTLIYILVDYKDTKIELQEYMTANEFMDSLNSHPLVSTNSMFLSYRLNQSIDLNFAATHRNSVETWEIHKHGQAYFSFTCTADKEFLTLFEKHLVEVLSNDNNVPPSLLPPDPDVLIT